MLDKQNQKLISMLLPAATAEERDLRATDLDLRVSKRKY